MPTKHVTRQIEAYLDRCLSARERAAFEAHLATCPACAQQLANAWRVASELKPALKKSLGEPMPPAGLRYRVRQAINEAERPRQRTFPWALSGRVLNAVGTLAVLALLAFGAFVVLQGRLPGTPALDSQVDTASQTESGSQATDTPTPARLTGQPIVSTTPARQSVGDTLPRAILPTSAQTPAPAGQKQSTGPEPQVFPFSGPEPDDPELPEGLIAFSFYNSVPGRQQYEIHLIKPDGTGHRRFPLAGVSEPALRATADGHQLAYRAWGEPTSPRSLLSSNLKGEFPHRVGGYWEDAQPDWSPTEYRLIFASQRESDRRWRLYTSWGNGLAEKELRREGRSPSFAPDGHHFVFEGCDDTANRCGLWEGKLSGSEFGSQVVLEDARAKAPDWSPVGEQIVYMANPNKNWDLYLFDRAEDTVRRLTTDRAIDGLPAWSPDGKWVAFLSNRDGAWGIWVLHVASGDLQQIFELDRGKFDPPTTEPYGEHHWWDEQISWSR